MVKKLMSIRKNLVWNLSVALAIALVAFGKDGIEISLIVALAYIIQVQGAAGFLRLVDRLFGRPNQELSQQMAE